MAPHLYGTTRLVVAGMALAAVATTAACGGSAEATDHDQSARSVALHVRALYRTTDPRTLITPIAESTTDTSSACWVKYDVVAAPRGDDIEVRMTSVGTAPHPGYACANGAVAAYQDVRLPAAYDGQRIIDAADGDPIPVYAPLPSQSLNAPPAS
jgi:ABC-type glycerol-3-phosphate transport system substrate-binding protein